MNFICKICLNKVVKKILLPKPHIKHWTFLKAQSIGRDYHLASSYMVKTLYYFLVNNLEFPDAHRTGSISPLISQMNALSQGRGAGDTESSPTGGHVQFLVEFVRCLLFPIPKCCLNQEPLLTCDTGTLTEDQLSSPITAGSITGHQRFLCGVCNSTNTRGFSQRFPSAPSYNFPLWYLELPEYCNDLLTP